ncbi:MAG: hypothetical protein K9J16_08455 [Melioribacteraceae bacterium]|nr:hypothetical protein [Melioribacteraceae bacterium]MCF8353825.1 hypothetical protein [Melioribacteraceae bacterium]MCF8393661.1 hypothetical protein [Melioribacteraceae bacterium]MCF8419471.1 hypothetical protein [Melioribacteraceae bacterium]
MSGKTFVFILILLFTSTNFAQLNVKSNYEFLLDVLDKSAAELADENHLEGLSSINFTAPQDYLVFGNRVKMAFKKYVMTENENSAADLNYTIENASIFYGEPFKKGLFGSHYIERIGTVSGTASLNGDDEIFSFNSTLTDTIRFDDLRFVENPALPFTQGEIPGEPLFSSILEPAIAIGTAVITIVLFFSVRSK